jgi:hypothetical protein
VRLLNNEGYLTAAEIAETLDAPLVEVLPHVEKHARGS